MKNWTSFVKRITVNSSTEEVYRAWATKAGIESWFLRHADFAESDGEPREPDEFVQAGDSYIWGWHGWGDEADQDGKILTANGKDSLSFTFHEPMVVVVRILSEFDTAVVELTQKNIPPDEDSAKNYYVGCGEGWTFYLANLKSLLEGGVDLRNKDVRIKKVVNS